jgi:hypothetical protein
MRDSNLSSVVAQSAVLLPACIFAVALRFIARVGTQIRYGWDDWLSVMSLIAFILWQSFAIYGTHDWTTSSDSSLD